MNAVSFTAALTRASFALLQAVGNSTPRHCHESRRTNVRNPNMTIEMKRLVMSFALVACAMLSSRAEASNLEGFEGYWHTPDKSVIEIKPCPAASALCGYLTFAREYGTDELNPDPALRKRPLCGLLVLELRRWADGVWRDGTVYDPETGKGYKAALRKRDGKLFLRAYVGTEVFGETESWTSASGFKTPCKP